MSRALSGAQVGPWYAPNITSDPIGGIGSWNKEELVAYLRSGRLREKAQAAGSMAEAVEHSFQHLSASDLDAIATYVKGVPAVHNKADDVNRFSSGKMFSELTTLRCRGGVKSDDDADPAGAQLFQGNCASCHSAEGQGSKDGYYPSLFRNSATGAKNATDLIATILYGVDPTTSGDRRSCRASAATRSMPIHSVIAISSCWATMCSLTMGRPTQPLPNNRSPRCVGVGPPPRCSRSCAGASRPQQSLSF
jgi:mono/diheme cytochrome c family protein